MENISNYETLAKKQKEKKVIYKMCLKSSYKSSNVLSNLGQFCDFTDCSPKCFCMSLKRGMIEVHGGSMQLMHYTYQVNFMSDDVVRTLLPKKYFAK